ncbi:trace amine-associated receptor 3-like [Salarias fasciatus]|uniref:Trace amine-associated receptor 3-like n=1 Tax=Salarias fasciatus TaxID=181472 RepID=A0A672JD75_SALFA|nr:trace amine-associated receptor 3-like [Salarias fasciatus]
MEATDETELCFPTLPNSSCRRTVNPHSVSMTAYVTLSCISLLTVALNLLVIISISHFKKLHTPTNILLLSLAVSDFLVGFIMLFQILGINGCWYLGDLTCVIYLYFDYIVTSASVGTMVLISVDRYIAVCDPLHYSSKVTENRVKLIVLQCWLGSALCHTLLLKENLKHPGSFKSCAGECVLGMTPVAGIMNLILTFIGPVAVIILLYMRVFVVAVSQARAMRSHVAVVTLQSSGTVLVKKSELKAARSLGVVVLVFLLCLCPFYCVTISGQDTAYNLSSIAFVLNLLYFNSCLNPLIYAFFYPWFRRCVKLIVTLQILRPRSGEANVMEWD